MIRCGHCGNELPMDDDENQPMLHATPVTVYGADVEAVAVTCPTCRSVLAVTAFLPRPSG